MHCGAEVTESSTNKQHHRRSVLPPHPSPPVLHNASGRYELVVRADGGQAYGRATRGGLACVWFWVDVSLMVCANAMVRVCLRWFMRTLSMDAREMRGVVRAGCAYGHCRWTPGRCERVVRVLVCASGLCVRLSVRA